MASASVVPYGRPGRISDQDLDHLLARGGGGNGSLSSSLLCSPCCSRPSCPSLPFTTSQAEHEPWISDYSDLVSTICWTSLLDLRMVHLCVTTLRLMRNLHVQSVAVSQKLPSSLAPLCSLPDRTAIFWMVRTCFPKTQTLNQEPQEPKNTNNPHCLPCVF